MFSFGRWSIIYGWKVFPGLFITYFSEKFGADKLYWVTRDRDSKINLDVSTQPLNSYC